MTVAELVQLLSTLPQDYDIFVDRGGAYSDARSLENNHVLRAVFVSAETPDGPLVSEYGVQR